MVRSSEGLATGIVRSVSVVFRIISRVIRRRLQPFPANEYLSGKLECLGLTVVSNVRLVQDSALQLVATRWNSSNARLPLFILVVVKSFERKFAVNFLNFPFVDKNETPAA